MSHKITHPKTQARRLLQHLHTVARVLRIEDVMLRCSYKLGMRRHPTKKGPGR